MALAPGQPTLTSCRLGVLRLDAGRLDAFPPVEAFLAQTTQVVAEVFTAQAAATRTTQLTVEAFTAHAAATRATQLVVEVFFPRPVEARVTQAAAELFLAHPAATLVTSTVVELFTTTTIEPPPPVDCALPLPIEPADDPGSCPPLLFDPDQEETWGDGAYRVSAVASSPPVSAAPADPPAVACATPLPIETPVVGGSCPPALFDPDSEDTWSGDD